VHGLIQTGKKQEFRRRRASLFDCQGRVPNRLKQTLVPLDKRQFDYFALVSVQFGDAPPQVFQISKANPLAQLPRLDLPKY
jgi:hypothetical protein